MKHEKMAHRNTKEYPCDLCDSKHIDRRSLMVHMRRVHCNEPVGLKNETPCQATIKTEEEKRERGDCTLRSDCKKFKCEECPYSSSQHIDLQRHVNAVHKNIKDHVCNLCGYATYHKHALTRHERQVHLNMRDHACDECDLRFKVGLCRFRF